MTSLHRRLARRPARVRQQIWTPELENEYLTLHRKDYEHVPNHRYHPGHVAVSAVRAGVQPAAHLLDSHPKNNVEE